jgi:hypothetical protein
VCFRGSVVVLASLANAMAANGCELQHNKQGRTQSKIRVRTHL